MTSTDFTRNPLAPGGPMTVEGGPMDPQELSDRVEATDAYAGETPEHFVKYGQACLDESERANADVRAVWKKCWRAHQLHRDGPQKEDWQSEIILADPFVIAQQAKAIVRQALVERPDYFEITDPVGDDGEAQATFYTEELKIQLNPQHGNFPVMFADACEMGFAVGQSPEIIPVWVPKRGGTQGLRYETPPPWHIFRDPDARPRDPWSGMYWIHREYVDYWVLKSNEIARDPSGKIVSGIYQDIDKAKSGGEGVSEREKERRLKDQVWTRHPYRTSMQVNEQWGAVLDKQGRLLLPSARFTFSGDTLIRPPVPSMLPTLPWPGISFSPIPHLERFEGRGLVEGILSLWLTSMNLLDLTLDDMNWVVNRMFEIDPNLLLDGGKDAEVYPGKAWFTRAGAVGGQAIREIQATRGKAADALPLMAFMESRLQKGSFTTSFVTGQAEDRGDVTATETQLKSRAAHGIFDSIARELEIGAVQALWATIETLAVNWTQFSSPSVAEALGEQAQRFTDFAMMDPAERVKALQLQADIQVRGISSAMQRDHQLQRLDAFMRRAESPVFAPYIKPYNLLKAEVAALGLGDEDVILTDKEVQAQQAAQQQAMAAQPGDVTPPARDLVTESLQAAGLQNGGGR